MKQPDDNIGTVKDLVLHRIETAKSDIKSAQILLDAEEYRSSNNRAYYGIYHAISAIHAFSKGNQSRIFIRRTDVEAETPIRWPPDVKN